MPEAKTQFSQAETDLLTQVCHFAANKAINGVYMAQLHSKSLGAPVLLIFALGEQALALQQVVMQAAVPDEASLIERVKRNGNLTDHEFFKD